MLTISNLYGHGFDRAQLVGPIVAIVGIVLLAIWGRRRGRGTPSGQLPPG